MAASTHGWRVFRRRRTDGPNRQWKVKTAGHRISSRSGHGTQYGKSGHTTHEALAGCLPTVLFASPASCTAL